MSMSGTPDPKVAQPPHFEFSPVNMAKARAVIAKYPSERQQSALLPLLDLAQRQNGGWLPIAAMNYVADLLEIPRIRAYEVASFYTMYNTEPVGKNLVQVCTTTPCWLKGADDVLRACKDKTGCGVGESSPDGKFTVVEVECLGACVNAPMMQVNDETYEDLTYDNTCKLLDALAAGQTPKPGSQTNRHGSEAQDGATTLKTIKVA